MRPRPLRGLDSCCPRARRAVVTETLADDPGWVLYVLWSERLRRTYAGITIDLERRLAQHNGEQPGGARATRAGRPWQIATTYGPYPDRSSASRAERAVKRLRGRRRLSWAGDLG